MPLADPTTLRTSAEEHLRALVGHDDARLRDDQWSAIEALVVDRRRALVVQRTGWGKSAVYFVATALLRATGAGPTVIISPLLALMRNQIAAAERAGIRAVTINSTNIEQWQHVHDDIAAGLVDVLLVSPERLNNPGFRDEVLPRLAASAGLLVVDEAHCISDWGHDFRPDYRRLRTLLAELPDGIPVLATTATANARVTADVADQLGSDVLVLRGSLDRDSLRLGVVRLRTAEQRLAWLADHLAEQPGSGIVYCLTVAATQEVADYLRSRGHTVAAYSGQTETTERLALEDDLVSGRVKALIATSALGMGFDAAPGLRRQPRGAVVAGRLLPAGRPRRPRHRAGHQRDGGAAAGAGGPRHLGLLRVAGLPARARRPTDAGHVGRPGRRDGPSGEHAGPRGPGGAHPHPARVDAEGARRRRRRTPGPGRVGEHRRRLGLRRRALRRPRRRPPARAGRHAGLPRHRPVPDVVPARPARRRGQLGRRAAGAVAATTAAA